MTCLTATPAIALPETAATGRLRRPSIWNKLGRDKAAMLASVFLVAVIALGVLAPWITPYDPYDNNLRNMLKPPSQAYWLGNDGLGRDMVSRLLFGIRTTLTMGIIAVAAGGSICAVLGLMAAYFRLLEGPIMRVVDVLLSFPSILFGLAIAAVLGAGTFSITIALTVAAVPAIARITRASLIETLRTNYVRTARAKGLPFRKVVLRHAFKSAMIPVVTYLGPATVFLLTGSMVI